MTELFVLTEDAVISRRMLRAAYTAAGELSDDDQTKNGALVVDPNTLEVLGRGANRFPPGVEVTPERLERPAKYQRIVHAEVDAVLEALRRGHSTIGMTLYCPWASCTGCAKVIIKAGIRRVVVHKAMHDKTPERWVEEIAIAKDMFKEAGVEYCEFDGKIGLCGGTFDGQPWQP
jgi:dCMP deaminase